MLFMDWSAGLRGGPDKKPVKESTKKGASAPFFMSRLSSEIMPDIEGVVARSDHGRAVSAPHGVEV